MSAGHARSTAYSGTAEGTQYGEAASGRLDCFWFLRQVAVGTYVVDIVGYDALWVVEVDDGQHVRRQSQVARQTAWLEAREFRVPGFWNNEVLADVEAVKTLFAEACGKGTSP